MITLTGKNLGERQQELNKKVNDAAKDKIEFNTIEQKTEKSDVDKFFKIDLAAKYKNIEYIIQIFKCRDSLHISRALNKCDWLCDEDFKHIVNSDYLSTNIYPSMSIKMRNHMLNAVATYLKNDDPRAIDFYAYCMKIKLYNIALKYLIHASESFKLGIILKRTTAFTLITKQEGKYLEHFIGNSFNLAESYVKNIDYIVQKGVAVYFLRYMYTLSNEKYLDMLETCNTCANVLGRRISKHIIQNHKCRVMKKPLLYANTLNKDVISRNVKIGDAKMFAVALLPDRCTRFFNDNYYENNKFVLDVIPAEEKFLFIKKIFCEKYKDVEFETSADFYNNNFFDIMTIQQKESWALQNIASQKEVLGSGNDYLWYKFVNFEKAFPELRNQIMKTTDANKRSKILEVLIDSARNEENLTKLLNYFGDRHRNEVSYVTERFLDKLIRDHKVWRFGENCWQALEKIFYILEVFNISKHNECSSDFTVVALMYYVLNSKPVPDVLLEYLEINAICFYTLRKFMKRNKSKTETDVIFQYVLKFYTEKTETLSTLPPDNETKKKIHNCIRYSLQLAKNCDKTKNDIPEIMWTYIKLDWPEFKYEQLLANEDKLSSSDIVHYLKKDATLVVDQFPQIKDYCESKGENLNWLVHKLKIYFSNDIAEQYLALFNDCLSANTLHYRTADIAVRGTFILADWTRKIEFLEKYIPNEKTIDKSKISQITLDIQRAICRQMHCSRPPLPLTKVFQYVVGDYVQYCLVLFRSFLINLPYLQSVEFIQKMIESPVSIQKHGLRLAFECFDTKKLQKMILDAWKRTKNVTLRMVLYKLLYTKIANENDEIQLKLFEVLITLTLDLNEDDQESLQITHTVILPDHLIGRYLEALWETVSKFSEKPQNFALMAKTIKIIERKLCLVPENCVDKIIDDHVRLMLNDKQILQSKFKQGFDDLLSSKWDLTKSSLVYVVNEKKLEKSLMLARNIVKQCIGMWHEVDTSNSKYIIRHFLSGFIAGLDSKIYDHNEKCYSNVVILMQTIEDVLKKSLPEKEIYKLVWLLQSSVVTIKVFLDLNIIAKAANTENIIKSGVTLGKYFGILIKTNVEKGFFHQEFSKHILDMVDTAINNIFVHFKRYPIESTDMQILFCSGLLENQIFETYMMALKILPLEYEGNLQDDYISAMKKIQAFPNKELQFCVYEKFVNTDFKKRNFVNL